MYNNPQVHKSLKGADSTLPGSVGARPSCAEQKHFVVTLPTGFITRLPPPS
jgi:hypothetical protein